MTRAYRFLADTDSLEAFRRLRQPWSGHRLVDGELHVRLAAGGSVRLHVDAQEIEPDFVVASVVADAFDHSLKVPDAPSAFAAGGHDVLVFRGVTGIEGRSGEGVGATLQLSGPPHAAPEAPEALCETTDAVAVLTATGGCVVRVGLKPGHLEWVDDPEEVSAFLRTRGYGGG